MTSDFAVITKNPEETIEFGKDIAKKLKNGDVVALYGDLGSGKTQVVKGICSALGVADTVNSPTFIIVNEYTSQSDIKIYHLDLYRMKSEDDVINIGIDDYLKNRGILLIEWPEHIERLLPSGTIKVHLAHTNECETCRYIKLSEARLSEEKSPA
jgi:tRNA threonylcarbamoyladenosine biosynthesis protein TsaE